MKKSVFYITVVTSAMLWITPGLSMADTTPETAPIQAMGSSVIEVAKVEDLTASTGPSLEAQQAKAEAEAKAKAEQEAEAARNSVASARQNLVNYALQFVGGPYRAGGNDPRTGADCSGFTKYVMQHGAGITMNRSSGSQATQGVAVSSSQMQPGDLIFYGSGSGINHVALYIGNGQIVHASTYKTGIKVSQWNYRSPVKIISMFG